MQRIGVFVCHCGTNIAGTVDVKSVAEALKSEPGVVFSTDYQYMCSEAGQNMVKDAIKEYNLTGVVICSCSPRMHENTFRKAAASVGLNPYMVEIANIREQCSWIHKDMATATEKAVILGRTAIAKVQLNTPLVAGESPVTKRALVIGGGNSLGTFFIGHFSVQSPQPVQMSSFTNLALRLIFTLKLPTKPLTSSTSL